MLARFVAAWLLALAFGEIAQARDEQPTARVLIFTHATGWRHDSIDPGAEALRARLEADGRTVVVSSDPDVFLPHSLSEIEAVLLLSTTSDSRRADGDWWQGARGESFEAWVRDGGAVVGVHAAADSHYGWDWYGRMLGAWFESHPPGLQRGTVSVETDHPSTHPLPDQFEITDEWYYFKDFNPNVNVLLTVDPRSIGQADINPNPISWSQEFEGARVFYTALGHPREAYENPLFLDHVAGGLSWALGET